MLVSLVRYIDPSFVESVRLRYFDQLITSKPATNIPVSVVNIDDASLDKFGQWPFPRDVYASIIEDLYSRGAGLVVFDVLMPEKDRFNKDAALVKTFENYPVVMPVLGGLIQKNSSFGSEVQPIGVDPHNKVVEYPGLINNISSVEEVAAGIGIVNTFPEIDGVTRRMPLVILNEDFLYPSLALETLRVYSKDTKIQVKIDNNGVNAVRIPNIGKISTDGLSRVWVDWSQSPKEYSLTKLPKNFNNEIVIVGLSAAGLTQPIATAKGGVWPQTIQAEALGTMLSGTNIQRPDWVDTAELCALLIMGCLMIFIARWTYGFIPVIIALCGAHFVALYLYGAYHYLVDVTWFIIGAGLVYIHSYTLKFVSEFLQKQQIRKQFSTYLSPDLVAKLVRDPSLLKLGGEEKELTIMFTDVRGFTSISEHYGRDVQGLTKIMNRYMTAMTKKILENEGTLDKYIGDAQMAFWNAPLDESRHCKDAVKAALEMLDSLKEFNAEIVNEGAPAFGMGIGLNTGVVVVGNMGSDQRFDYTCLGDSVNLASRLEGQSKNYGVLIVLGPVTAQRVDGDYFTLPLDCIAVKGKHEGVDISTVFYNPPADKMKQWETDRLLHKVMLQEYRNQQWDSAIKALSLLKGAFDGQMDYYYKLWAERIEEMRSKNLPATWDGIYRATSK